MLSSEKLEKFVHSYLFILAVIIGPILGWAFDCLAITYYYLGSFVLLILFLSCDIKLLLLIVPFFLTGYKHTFDINNIPTEMVISSGVLIISIVLMVFKNIVYKKKIHLNFGLIGKSVLMFGFVLLLSAFVRNVFYNEPAFPEYPDVYKPMLGYIGALVVIGAGIISIIISSINTGEYMDVYPKIMYTFGLYLFIQFMITFSKNGYDITEAFTQVGWGNKNQYAILCELSLPFLAYIFGNNMKRIDALGLFGALSLLVLASDSRGAQVTILILSLYCLYLLIRKTKHVWINYAAIILIGLSAFVLCFFTVDSFKDSVIRLYESIINGDSFTSIVTGRDVFWKWTFEYTFQNPKHLLLGGSPSYMFELYRAFTGYTDFQFWMCHNTLISSLALGGLLGVLTIIYLYIEVIGGTIKRAGDLKWPLIGIILFSLVHGIIDETLFYLPFTICFIFIFQSYSKNFKEFI